MLFIKKSTLATALSLSVAMIMTGCAKHESAEGKDGFKTEAIAAKQGEEARAAVPVPDAKEPAKFVASAPAKTASATASTATSSSTTTTTTTTKTEEKPTAKIETKAETKDDTKTAVVKETKVVTTKTEVKTPEADKPAVEKK